MNRISHTNLAKNEPLEPLLEKEVQVRAFELCEQHGKGHGFALQDWLERRLKSWLDFTISRYCNSPVQECKKLFRSQLA